MAVLSGEWSGAVGDSVAETLHNLIGLVGSFILLLGLLTIALTLLVDLDIQQSYERLQEWFGRLRVWLKQRRSAQKVEVKKEEGPPLPRRSVEIKRDSTEHVPPPPVPRKILMKEKEPEIENPAPNVEETQQPAEPEGEVSLDINEPVQEEEVNFDEREVPRDVEEEEIDYVFPSVELLDAARGSEEVDEEELKANAELLREAC